MHYWYKTDQLFNGGNLWFKYYVSIFVAKKKCQQRNDHNQPDSSWLDFIFTFWLRH